MRKMATIQIIDSLAPIEGADKIELATVLGWQVVVQKGLYEVGDKVCYCEVDGFVPHSLVDLSRGGSIREYNGVPGNKLRTIKLRGQISQGMCLPLFECEPYFNGVTYEVGDDVSEPLGIVKYEPPVAAHLMGLARGNFPSWLRKTDQDRIQNVYGRISHILDDEWIIEEKLEGSSMTVGHNNGDLVVCSRNLSLKLEGNDENSFVKTANDCGILTALASYGRNIGISGELLGNIQGNIYHINGFEWRIFDILDVDTQKYVDYDTRMQIVNDLQDHGAKLLVAPLLARRELKGSTIQDLKTMADGKSVLNPKTNREGLVFKNQRDPDISFKSVSAVYLLKEKD